MQTTLATLSTGSVATARGTRRTGEVLSLFEGHTARSHRQARLRSAEGMEWTAPLPDLEAATEAEADTYRAARAEFIAARNARAVS
ncbi:hypothetical protein [Streptomyces iconiensis]|uniref:Uncharacterized protein n=1 Tax=Streptomyces iconiensis TaxID=1384038 RepID=A0ABT6ZWL4_9ACTN|nr:hypothetical protein [Streptomyces iconiensis]MDJ1133462.1 hypothetical protein [Streptomyces iconiensis]